MKFLRRIVVVAIFVSGDNTWNADKVAPLGYRICSHTASLEDRHQNCSSFTKFKAEKITDSNFYNY